MKRVLSLTLTLMMLLSVSVTAFASEAASGSSSTGSRPVLPEGFFESYNIGHCYREYDTIYAVVEFENIVDDFKLIMATYNDENEMCSVKSFDISYLDSAYELEMDANGGDRVKIFLWEDMSGLVPLCELNTEYIPTEYGYILSVDKAEEMYEITMLTAEDEIKVFDMANNVVIDEEHFECDDSRIKDRLEFAAESANKAYEDETNAAFHQPVMYAVNENGELAHIDTVVSSVNRGISRLLKDDDGEGYSVPYGYREYTQASKTLVDFRVNSKTKIFFVPDDRSDIASYRTYEKYSDAFINTLSYHVEAYGLSASDYASLVLIYKENSDMVYTYKAPMLIVDEITAVDDKVYATGYSGLSYDLKSVEVDTARIENIDAIGKGDVIRYLTDKKGIMADYTIWYDADNALQNEPCDSMEEAIENRILELMAGRVESVTNRPDAAFRLQYGTVYDIDLGEEGNAIYVTASIDEDNFDMVTDGDGVISWEMDDSVELYEYDGKNLKAAAIPETIRQGESKVIAYSVGGVLKSVYIVSEPYVSEKKIMTVQRCTEKITGYEIRGYSEGEQLIVSVDSAAEPVVKDIYIGRVIAYVPDGNTIKDIEIVFNGTGDAFDPKDGESLIAKDTKETLVFGLSEYTTDGAVVNGVKYTVTEDTNYLLVKYAGSVVNYGVGMHREMKNEYVLIRVKANKPTEIADVVIFQELN